MKIYNEVVIDMNPESSTFEEVLYEDSYDYDGDDIMLALSEDAFDLNFDLNLPELDFSFENLSDQHKQAMTTYGLESLSKKDFFDESGNPLYIDTVVQNILKHKPMPEGYDGGIDAWKKVIKAQVKDFFPKLQKVSEKDKQFAREGFQKDVYGISKDAAKAGKQMQQAYGSGMGSQMRGAYGAQKDVAQKYSFAEQGYEQDIYGLEREKEAEFESNVGNWLQGFKEGGRVPEKKQTFLDVLSKIPDAGGS